MDTKPIPGMVITPSYGLAALNSQTPIRIDINPVDVIKFDVKVMIQVRGGKMLELRLNGDTERPHIDIDVDKFDFGGVFSGASASLPFRLSNKSSVKARIDFKMKRYGDFSVRCGGKTRAAELLALPDNNYQAEIGAEQSLDLVLHFSPTEVAAYDFELPIYVNQTTVGHYDHPSHFAMTNSMSIAPHHQHHNHTVAIVDTHRQSEHQQHNNHHHHHHLSITSRSYLPIRHVIATGMRHAIELSETRIAFQIPIAYLNKLSEGGFYDVKSTVMHNRSQRPIKWCLDMRQCNQVLEQGVFKICDGSMIPFVSRDPASAGPEGELKPGDSYELKVLFCPRRAGAYTSALPIVINDNFAKPYYTVDLYGELLEPSVLFEPDVLILRPVPLGVAVSDRLVLKPSGYEKTPSRFRVSVAPALTLDGDSLTVMDARFDADKPLELIVNFASPKPIATNVKLTISDDDGREYAYYVCVTADNSTLTCYEFLLENYADYRLVLHQDTDSTDGAKQAGAANKANNKSHQHHHHNKQQQNQATAYPVLRALTNTSRLTQSRLTCSTADMYNTLNEKINDLELNVCC